jgi:hypothetical protein
MTLSLSLRSTLSLLSRVKNKTEGGKTSSEHSQHFFLPQFEHACLSSEEPQVQKKKKNQRQDQFKPNLCISCEFGPGALFFHSPIMCNNNNSLSNKNESDDRRPSVGECCLISPSFHENTPCQKKKKNPRTISIFKRKSFVFSLAGGGGVDPA